MSQLRPLLARGVGFRISALVILASVAIVSCLAIPLLVTVDGILYISSAKSIFSESFAGTYAWFREPGYPIFLAIVHAMGGAGVLLILVQAICLGLSGFIVLYVSARALGWTRVPLGVLVVVTILLLNPMYLIYSALVLQQALLTLQLALLALAVSWAISRPSWLPAWLLLLLVLVHYSLSILTSIGWLYLGLVPVTLVVALSLRRLSAIASVRLPPRVRLPLTIAGSLLLVVAVYAIGLSVYGAWTAFKAPYLASASGIPSSIIQPISTVPYIPTPFEMTQRMLALMHIGSIEPYVKENSLFLYEQLVRGYPHAEWDTAYVALPYTSFARGYFTLTDPVGVLHHAYGIVARVASPVYAATFVGFLVSIVAIVAMKRWHLLVIMAVPVSFLAVYAASNSPIDRYGIPTYPFAVVAVVSVVAAAVEHVRRRCSRH